MTSPKASNNTIQGTDKSNRDEEGGGEGKQANQIKNIKLLAMYSREQKQGEVDWMADGAYIQVAMTSEKIKLII